MLPRLLFRLSRGPMRRSRLIPQYLIDDQIDIIVFQEAFDPRARRLLKRRLKDTYPYMVGPANHAKFRFKTNSGVWMASKIPLKHLGEIRFSECEGSDCLAKKGALLVETEWQGVKIQVLGTHLESGGTYEMKRGQYSEIRRLTEKHREEGVPLFLSGDFNTSKTNTELYLSMLDSLDAEDGDIYSELQYTADELQNDMNYCPPKREPHRKVIDFVLYQSNGLQPNWMERHVRQYQQRWCNKYQDLSDHNAVLMRVKF